MRITFPNVLAIHQETVAGDLIRQLARRTPTGAGPVVPYTRDRLRAFLLQPEDRSGEILILPTRSKMLPDGCPRIVFAESYGGSNSNIEDGKWLRHPLLNASATADREALIARVLDSWVDAFSFVAEDPDRDVIGLRKPQIGALHAVHAHWSVSESTATIVMPTGTGKTDTILSMLVSAGCPRLLVIVPTDALRTQIAEKFLTLGILKHPRSTILRPKALFPVVCTLRHIPRSPTEVDEVFGSAQIVVTTSAVAGQCAPAVQERMAHHCPYLFIDEAHHAEAPTWSTFKQHFRERRIVQFTATPFREDGKPLDGDIVFRYPLKKAQQEGYFKPIRFEPVVAFNRKKADAAIARKAVEQLRADADKGHILMARVEGVTRAEEIYRLYAEYPEFNPVQLHTGIKSARQREDIRQLILSGKSRIIVCVDMLGEGFDLPELKIAAFHDIRKTLAVTLQLVGRFTRARSDLGEATFIANTADVNVQEELRKLYTRDPDWNTLLPQLSDRMIGEQISIQQFLHGFTQFTDEIPLRTVRPANSVVVYKTRCDDWTPENFREGIPGIDTCEQVHYAINVAAQTLIVVTAQRAPLLWTTVESLYSWDWQLYVAFWSQEQHLLFINGSTNAGEFKPLAEALAGDSASLMRGNEVFRAFAGIHRLRLQNVGLTEQLGRHVRYTGRMGSDVGPGLPDVHRRSAWKSVLSGSGYEDGERTTIGASRKGRIWAHRRDRVDQLVKWCKAIGGKLLDTTIDPDEVLKGTLEAKPIVARPERMPVCVDWPEEIYTSPESQWSVLIGRREYTLSELDIAIVSPNRMGSLRFAICSETDRAELELLLFVEDDVPNCRFDLKGDATVQVRGGERARPEGIANFFYNAPPVIWFHDGSMLEGNQYTEPKTTYTPFDAPKIQVWDWTGTDITKESQGPEKAADSIQARVIRELLKKDYTMIVDDDSKGEAADVVAIRLDGEMEAATRIDVEFYHCKFSLDATPGQRIKDLYELCGQAQKSIFWMSSSEKRTDLFTHLLRREERRRDARSSSRYERGDNEILQTIKEMSRLCPVSISITVVQPGLSRRMATRDQLELLSVTENHLFETFRIAFGVIGSA